MINPKFRVSMLPLASCLVIWVSVSVLLPSLATAQVNGSGPSPSSDFDIVLNLPGDEAIITGAFGESIGGMQGQTTQLNVLSGGVVGRSFDANSGSEVNISGGMVGSLSANSGSEVNISGGTVFSLGVESGSEVNISGGTVGPFFLAESGSEVTISGGTFGIGFGAEAGSDVELIGGEFRLNGADFSGGTISLASGDVFTGTLADGSPFIFGDPSAAFPSDSLTGVTLTAVPLPPVDLNPIVITDSISGPSGLRPGQTLTVVAGGSLPDNFAVVDATLNIAGGRVVGSLEVSDGEVNISGGGANIDAFDGSVVNVSGGTANFSANSGSVVNISGGTIFGNYFANSGSLLNISGGEFDDLRNYTYLGDYVRTGLFAESGSGVNIFGSRFRIEDLFTMGQPVELDDDLVLGQPVSYNVRTTVHLSTLLPDGNFFIISLDPFSQILGGAFSREAGLGLTLTAPAAEPVLLGDCNLDGVVDFADIGPFIMILQDGSFLEEADCNEDGVVDFADIGALVAILQNI